MSVRVFVPADSSALSVGADLVADAIHDEARRRDDRVDPIAVEPADRRPVKQGGGGKGAIAEAVNRFDVEARMVVVVADLDPVTKFQVRDEVLAAHRLTGFGATKLQDPAVNRRAVKVVIKTDHAERFGFRDVKRISDEGNDAIIDVAKLLLQIVQDWQHGAWRVALPVDQRLRQIQIKGRSARHDILPDHLINARRGV